MPRRDAPKLRAPCEQWEVTEPVFRPDDYALCEAVMALANGYLGQRASFEEGCTGITSLRGNYIAGVFDSYPNPTMIKLKGRPDDPRQIVNTPDHLPLLIMLNGERLDLSECRIEQYRRTLNMGKGTLERRVVCTTPRGMRVKVSFLRFLSIVRRHLAATRISVTPLNRDCCVGLASLVDGAVSNVRTRHLDGFSFRQGADGQCHGLVCRTRSTGIQIAVLASETLDRPASVTLQQDDAATCSQRTLSARCRADETVTVEKIVAVATSRDLDAAGDAPGACERWLNGGRSAGLEALLKEHEEAWAAVWRSVAIDIRARDRSDELTQGLRYALFQMIQNAPADDAANIGAKGLTGEHYFGTYFWDTEVFMLPMFAFTLPEVARNLERSRARMLTGARRKAGELGLRGAMFPFMADPDGNECCTLWQFALMGVHVTADVAWGVWFYYCVTGDVDFIAEGGIDIMVETSRFWLSRVHFREDLGKYVINRVLGPDEYHQGVDNNFYTNIMARENLLKTCRLLEILRAQRPADYEAAAERLALGDEETRTFRAVAAKIHLPYDDKLGVDLQDDRFHLLEPYDLGARPLAGPVNDVWSYDRAMRTQVLRQADVVVAHLLVGDRFSKEQMRRDFEYYEPRTAHDSSLSFCTHSVVAAALGRADLAYDYFLRTARLDLDDLHGNTWMGIHAANLGGAWQCVVLGFGGVRWYNGVLALDPLLPSRWEEYSFSIRWHGVGVSVTVAPGTVTLQTDGGNLELLLGDHKITAGRTPAVFEYDTAS